MTSLITRQIDITNKTLPPKDIKDLNILFIWVIVCCSTPSVEELQALLQFENQEMSLRPLEVRIEEEYSPFLDILLGTPDESGNTEDSVVLELDSIE